MPGFQQAGAIRIGRSDGTSRYHEIVAYNDSITANNYVRFDVHNGTVGSNTGVLTLRGNGNVQFPQYGAGFLQTDASGNITAGSVTTSDTLDDVTDNGNSTTNSITVGGVTSTSDNTFKGDTYFENGGDDGAGTRVGNIWYSVSTGGGAAPVGVYESAVITTVQNGTHGRSDIVFKTKDNNTANFGSTSERMRITKDGKVGIGTTSPSSLLHLSSNNSTYESNGILSVSGGVNAVFNSTERFIFNIDSDNTQTDRSFDIAANRTGSSGGNLLFRVRENGNVGIGTTSPAGKLHLEGNFESGKALVIKGTYGTDTTHYIRTHGVNSEELAFYSGTAKPLAIDTSGRIKVNNAFYLPTADGSNGAVLVTNGSGALSWNNNYVQYSPIGWYLTTNTTYTTNADNIDSDSTQSAAGNTPVQRNSATEFQATKQGWYEITYNVVVKNNYANRACIGAYISYAHGQGGGVIQGSHSTEYVRYSTYGEYAQFTNTSYFYAPDAITKFYLRTLLKSGSMNMTTQAQNHNTITFRYINNIIS